jgi:hypothetical protein
MDALCASAFNEAIIIRLRDRRGSLPVSVHRSSESPANPIRLDAGYSLVEIELLEFIGDVFIEM